MPEYTPNHALPYPGGGDAVAVHSDIEKLALKTDVTIESQENVINQHYQEYLSTLPWRGRLNTTQDIDNLPSGSWALEITLPQLLERGMPLRYGTLFNQRLETGGFTQIVLTAAGAGQSPELWVRSSAAAGTIHDDMFHRVYPAKVATRTTAFSLNHPRGMDSEAGRNRQYRIPFRLGARARLKRVAFRNYDYNSDTPGVGQVELRNVGLGVHNMNPDGSMTGRFIEDSTVHTLLSGTKTAPDNHYVFYSDDVDLEIEPHTEYLLSYAYAADETMTVRRQLGQCFMNTILGSWNNTSQTVTATPQNYMGLHVWLELETEVDTPVWAYVGDSQLAGLSTTHPAYDSWARIHAYSHGAIPQILAQPSGSLADYQDTNRRMLSMWDHLDQPDRVYIAGLGSNDITNGRPFTGMQQYFETAAENIRDHFGQRLYLTTTLPRTGPSETDVVRKAYNDWLVTQLPAGAISATDHYAAVVDPSTGYMDERWQGPGGDVHLNTAGNARLAGAVDSPVTSTPLQVAEVSPGIYEIGAN